VVLVVVTVYVTEAETVIMLLEVLLMVLLWLIAVVKVEPDVVVVELVVLVV